MLTFVWPVMVVVGVVLCLWGELSLPRGTNMAPVPPVTKVRTGPYRFMNHPIYTANVCVVAGLAGIGGGVWVALSVGILAKLLFQQWIWMERQ